MITEQTWSIIRMDNLYSWIVYGYPVTLPGCYRHARINEFIAGILTQAQPQTYLSPNHFF